MSPSAGGTMDASTWERIETIFAAALERAAGERAAYLADACAGQPDLLAEVEGMLAMHGDAAGLWVERVLLDTAGLAAPAGGGPEAGVDRQGQRIGPWRLERLLGVGGMGEVWLAARADGQFDQRAALKLVRPGWRAAQLIPRFRRERQLLARLQHPNIATLLDGGLTDDGFPYLAMEYVDGEPVTAWCAARGSSLRERLALFREICEAVRFAHAKLVVHRDLKPQNILVTASGRPLLLDFGIATLLDPEDETPALTRDEDRVLTPEHAAPEQLRGEPATTATDIWALGVLLYELLTGARPFSGQDCTPLELERRVLHEEPPPPGEVAASRPAARALRGDLGRVVLKALRKEPERRFGGADEDLVFAALTGEVFAVDLSGAQPSGWSFAIGGHAEDAPEPILSGLGDVGKQIALGDLDDTGYVRRPLGPQVGWPRSFHGAVEHAAAAGDLDADGNVELVIAAADRLWILDMGVTDGPANGNWPMAGARFARSGCRDCEIYWSTAAGELPALGAAAMLYPSAPNPFRQSTLVRYAAPAAGARIEVGIYDVGGRLVRELVNEHQAGGPHEVRWDGQDAAGRAVASGVYLVRLAAGGEQHAARVVRLQ